MGNGDKQTGIHTNQELVHAITEVCQRQAWIIAMWVFGSTAKGSARFDSDIDIAILANNTTPDLPILPLITELERVINRGVDVVLLNRAGDLLRYEVRKHGRLMFERDPFARKEFEVRSRKSFEDFLHLHQKYVAKVLYGGNHG